MGRPFKKVLIYPWDINGYVKLSWGGKQKLIRYLISEYKTIKGINDNLGLPNYWFNNFKRNDKINTKEFKKIIDITNLNLVDDIRTYFESGFNTSTRSRKLVDTMKKKTELKSVAIGKYMIKGETK